MTTLKLPKFSHTTQKRLSVGITLTSIFLILFSVWWLLTTVIPVMVVEVKYQTKKFMSNVLHVDSVSELFFPDFSGLNFTKLSQYREYGIVIPSIYIDEPVIFNVDPNDSTAYTAALKQGIAHASGTTFPDNPGLGYYFAHSSNQEFASQYNAVFYLLGKLEVNDEIYIWHEGQDYKYLVTGNKVTEPSDVAFLNQEYQKETIVLQTCWPPGTTSKRLLVFAERVE